MISTDADLKRYIKELGDIPVMPGNITIRKLRNVKRLQRELSKDDLPDDWRNNNLYTIDGVRSDVVSGNLRMVIHQVKKYLNRGVPFLDLISEGNLALYRAIDKFDPWKKKNGKQIQFSTYACYVIQTQSLGVVSDSLIMKRGTANRIGVLRKAEYRLYIKGIDKPTDQELIDDLNNNGPPSTKGNWNIRSLAVVRKASDRQKVAQLDVVLEDERGRGAYYAPYPSRLSVDWYDPSDAIDNESKLKKLSMAMESLSSREKYVVSARNGLNGYDSHTLKQVGDKIGVTRERVRQIEGGALYKIQKELMSSNGSAQK